MSIRILLVDDNVEFSKEMASLLSRDEEFKIVGQASDGERGLAMFKELAPDVVILDLVMPKTDGFGFLQAVNKGNAKILVLSALSKDAFVQRAMDLGADYYMRKPCSFRELTQRIRELNSPARAGATRKPNRDMDERISNIFITVGIPAHIKGYQFLREAIKMAVENPEIINGSRRRRIAMGCGLGVQDINLFLKQFEQMQKMMKIFSDPKKLKKMRFPF